MLPISTALGLVLDTPSHGRLWERRLPPKASGHPAVLAVPEILLLSLTRDGMVKAQPAAADVFRFVFSDILFLAQLHCLRCELAAEHLVRRCCLGEE